MVIDAPHRRRNPLTGGWVLVSAGRTDRPWQGAVERLPEEDLPPYDPDCYLCPGNPRAGGAVNPDYESTFVFTNDFAALRPDVAAEEVGRDGLFRAEAERGTCRVLCFSPRHDLTLARADPATVRSVVDLWADQTAELGAEFRWVQVFENRGEMMGASNPHPHGQIWAGSALPGEPALEDEHQRAHLEEHGCRLLSAVAAAESESGERVVVENAGWIAFVPFWAVWPFETLLVPRSPVARLPDLDGRARDDLVDLLRRLLARYDNLFEAPFPYSMGWHGAPFGDGPVDHWLLHAHVYPPLLRSATVRKFMVGYELLAEAQRDLTPEEAAARLRSLPDRHFRDAG
ncbi:MAG: UDP-glucose--hexose-1-phosphate uridylyltransferase [Acidimicrobiia bacterium]|jgi:UDPglucose--hexose-1-phosphate uridylyltransferase